MTSEAKFVGIAKEIRERSQSNTAAILLVAHFPDVLARLNTLMEDVAIDVPLQAVPADNLSTDLASTMDLNESLTVDLIIGERHPLPKIDEQLVQFAEELPCRCRLAYHMSLEDPVMRVFAGEWVQGMLGQLGMTEHESIESKLVSRRIRQAQQQIADHSFGNSQAESAMKWLEENCPELIRE